jgi:hypothetical protein
MLCCWQVIDEALRQLLTVQAQRHATLQAMPNLIQHVQAGEASHVHIQHLHHLQQQQFACSYDAAAAARTRGSICTHYMLQLQLLTVRECQLLDAPVRVMLWSWTMSLHGPSAVLCILPTLPMAAASCACVHFILVLCCFWCNGHVGEHAACHQKRPAHSVCTHNHNV